MNSQKKGKNGELEVKHLFNDAGIPCRRGQQHSAIAADGSRHPDVVFEDEAFPYYVEVKRVERGNVHKMFAKAKAECPEGKIPMLVMRANNTPWLRITELKADMPSAN